MPAPLGDLDGQTQPPSSARLGRMVLACASIAIAAIIGLVLAILIGFAAPHQVAAPASSRGSGVVAQPGTSPGRPPVGSPARPSRKRPPALAINKATDMAAATGMARATARERPDSQYIGLAAPAGARGTAG